MSAPRRGLRPFFSFFGSKYRLAPLYPAPTHDIIVEPFAGSAGYSLLHHDRAVVLNDLDPTIAALWRWLIGVSEDDVYALPDLPRGTTVDDLDVPQEAKHLIGFWVTESQTYPSRYHLSPTRGGRWDERKRELIAGQLTHIRHWRVKEGPYHALADEEATWFVDPPYVLAGKRYRTPALDFGALGRWCLTRPGQAIVCESNGADWLPFTHLRDAKNGSNRDYAEVIYHRGRGSIEEAA